MGNGKEKSNSSNDRSREGFHRHWNESSNKEFHSITEGAGTIDGSLRISIIPTKQIQEVILHHPNEELKKGQQGGW